MEDIKIVATIHKLSLSEVTLYSFDYKSREYVIDIANLSSRQKKELAAKLGEKVTLILRDE